jgi:Rod binding domain-containing protein
MTTAFTLPAPGLSAADLLARTQASVKIDTPVKAKAMAAARDFEAVFINSMFQNMETGIEGDGPFGGSGAAGVWRSMLTDQYAHNLAKAGGIGIAAHVYQSLLAHQEGRS